ncbi:hypothetical protein EG832_09145, partial [bacterium]|nr:hypothetical protein [bacterium]
MAKLSRIFQPLVVLVLLFGTLFNPMTAAAQIGGETSNQFTQPDKIDTNWEIYQDIPPAFELAAENQTFRLFFNKTTMAFKVVDKRSGYVWHSNLDEKADGDRLNRTWTAFSDSGISIDYLDVKAQSKRNSITNAPNTIEVKSIDQGVESTVTFTDPSISLSVILRLEDTGLSIEVPFTSIHENNPEFKLGALYVYPFLGATREDQVPGYMFVPDGSGSLIRFQAATLAKNMYYGRYYGDDLGMLEALPWDPFVNRPYRISIPVYGMVHGYKQNGYISIVEKGASYGEVQVHPAGVITNFNFIYSAFLYNESYFQATNRSGAGVTTLQQKTNEFDIKIHYRFLTGDDSDYVGMARSYQRYLVDRGDLHKADTPVGDISVKLEFLGGEMEKVLFWKRLIPMTTVNQMSDILKGLAIRNQEVVYYGWQPLGASTMPPKNFKLDGGLGNTKELKALIDQITTGGGRFSLYLDPQSAILGGKGYSPRYDLAMAITDVNMVGFNRGKINNYLNLPALSDHYTALSDEVFTDLKAGLALDSIGSMLYTDFKSNHLLNRESAIAQYQDLLSKD